VHQNVVGCSRILLDPLVCPRIDRRSGRKTTGLAGIVFTLNVFDAEVCFDEIWLAPL